MNKPKRTLYLSFGVVSAIGFVALFLWYAFTFNQLSKYPPSQIAYMVAYDDHTAIEGYNKGYPYPMPPYAKGLYFFNKTMDKKHIKWLEGKGGLAYIFIKNALPMPDNANEIADHYIEQGLDINAVIQPDNATSLHYAVMMNHAGLTEFLIDRGANPNVRTSPNDKIFPNMTPLDIAKEKAQSWNRSIELWQKEVAQNDNEEGRAWLTKLQNKPTTYDILKAHTK